MQFSQEAKKSVNPFEVIDSIKSLTNETPKKLTSLNRTSFLVEVRNEHQAEAIQNLKKVHQFQRVVAPYDRFNCAKEIIFVNEYEDEDVEEFGKGLKESCNICEVQEATFIKKKNPNSKPYLVTFKQETVPHSICIPGERNDTI